MLTETYTIKLQFSQQGPIRYNSRVSGYNPRAVRRDAGRQLPHTGTVQRLSPAVRPRFQRYATPVLNLLPYTGQWRLIIDSDQARYSFIHVFPILRSGVLEIIGSTCSNETRTRVTSLAIHLIFVEGFYERWCCIPYVIYCMSIPSRLIVFIAQNIILFEHPNQISL